ncbi:MAG: glucose-6-phosphate dehydrogenase assembly protein OpcA [Chloroflexi bacterium]|nr:glucose-6-phosphate dehydrogenase assembly protein OpcA [Chloroflexota bacterium]
MLQTPLRTLSRHLPSTDVEGVARQLAAVMREISTSPDQQPQEAHALARASVLNLVVYTQDLDAAQRGAETIGALAGLHPSRSLVVVAEPAAPQPDLEATVTVRCQLHPSGGELLCQEEALLTARGAVAQHLGSVAVPLLIPDLPVYLWWVGPPPPQEEELLWVCHRLIVDSALFPDPLAQLGELHRLTAVLASRQRAIAFSDFTWARLTPWRELIAQFFDGPETLPYLATLRQVRIECAVDPGGTALTAQPLLLASWLAARLGWRPRGIEALADAREHLLTFDCGERQAEVRVAPRMRIGETGASGEVRAVELVAGEGDREGRFTVARTPDGEHATTRARLAGAWEVTRTVPMERASLVDLLRGELAILRHDRVFEQSLAVTARLLP